MVEAEQEAIPLSVGVECCDGMRVEEPSQIDFAAGFSALLFDALTLRHIVSVLVAVMAPIGNCTLPVRLPNVVTPLSWMVSCRLVDFSPGEGPVPFDSTDMRCISQYCPVVMPCVAVQFLYSSQMPLRR